MTVAREELFRRLYYALYGKGRILRKCNQCGTVSKVTAAFVSSEPCSREDCEAVDSRELTEDEFLTELNKDMDYLPAMRRELTLSQEVQRFIDTACQNTHDFSAEDRRGEEQRQAASVVALIVEDIVASRETLTDVKFTSIDKLVQTNPGLIESFLDDRFTRELISKIPGYVDRTLQFSRLHAPDIPSSVTNSYLSEAVRAYILGLPQASVALGRAALEQGLKERLGRQQSGEFVTFQELLKDAKKWNVLDRTMELCAREVANAGDLVMHEKPATLSEALDVLIKLRGLLEHIYSVDGHY
ncbi:MAG: DUF4145 domain-containing protein [Terriglobales bacterium]